MFLFRSYFKITLPPSLTVCPKSKVILMLLFSARFVPVKTRRLGLIPSGPVSRRCSVKKMSQEISQNSQENTLRQSLFFNKVAVLGPETLLKKKLWHRCFPVNFAKFLRTPFFTEHLRRLLLYL